MNIFQSDCSTDLTGFDPFYGILLVGMHQHEPHDPFLFVGIGIQDRGTGIQSTGIDPEIGNAAHEGIGGDFKCDGGKGFFRVGFAGLFFIREGVYADDGSPVERRRKIFDDGIDEQTVYLYF